MDKGTPTPAPAPAPVHEGPLHDDIIYRVDCYVHNGEQIDAIIAIGGDGCEQIEPTYYGKFMIQSPQGNFPQQVPIPAASITEAFTKFQAVVSAAAKEMIEQMQQPHIVTPGSQPAMVPGPKLSV